MSYQPTGVKKTLTQFGKISIANHHPFSVGKNGFQISPLLQERIVYVGQMDCYENCSDVLEKLSGVQVGATQIYRLTDVYGKQIEGTVCSGMNAITALEKAAHFGFFPPIFTGQ